MGSLKMNYKQIFFIIILIITIVGIYIQTLTFNTSGKTTIENTNICSSLDEPNAEAIANKYMNSEKINIECDTLSHVVTINENETQNISEASYTIQLNTKEIFEKFNTNDKHLECTIELFDKKYNVSELNTIETIEKFVFKKENNYTINLKRHGFYYIKCINLGALYNSFIYDETVNIFPRNMSILIDEKRDMILKGFGSELKFEKEEIKFTKNKAIFNAEEKMNVLMIGIESMSYRHLKRSMPLTFDYLNNKLTNNIMFTSVNIVGENTYPAMLALLAGISFNGVQSLNISSEGDKYHSIDEGFYDKYPFIWNYYEKIGYLTGYQVILMQLFFYQSIVDIIIRQIGGHTSH